jgi:hypothetical protein
MQLDSILSGSAPRIIKYQIAADTIANIPLLIPAANGAGLAQPTATSAANMVGVTLDAGTFGTAQNADNSDPAVTVSMVINPDAIYKASLSGDATEGSALATRDVTTLSATGLVVTTGDDWATPSVDEGTIWGYDQANAGIVRKVTSVSVTAATVTVAFPNDTAVGDLFAWANFHDLQSPTVTLTSNFAAVRAQGVAVSAAAAELMPVKIIAQDLAGDGLTQSAVLLISQDHAFGGRPT